MLFLTRDHKRGADWEAVRRELDLDYRYAHLGASQYIASHPRPVREAIERHRRALDADPVGYVDPNELKMITAAQEAAAGYAGGRPDDIALTESTTMGLATLYHGLDLRPGDEVLTTEHDYFPHHESIRLACARSGATARRVKLYDQPSTTVGPDRMVETIAGAVRDATRVVGVTWVHSNTGVKLPLRRIADALAATNARRDEADRVLLCVDGVHGFGIEPERVADLGCDFLASGCHKWMYGPRGTGILWGREAAWKRMRPTVPSFTEAMDAWEEKEPQPPVSGRTVTPGGFQAFEHRWSLPEAFAFHHRLGREAIAARVRELARRCKEGLAEMKHVTLHTPVAEELSAGIVCFEVRGFAAKEAQHRLREKMVIATAAPYTPAYLRLTPGIINTPEEVDRGLAAVRELA
ncbi:aminotransferase class V-fold PLP-dependent enzyme [Gemmata sp.]|uniref:aminotransferase class V-fold PLP-dependent enzyme n=1 Tax=Gemmata sp. TaxID=1914242 RepID=UPI003F7102F8